MCSNLMAMSRATIRHAFILTLSTFLLSMAAVAAPQSSAGSQLPLAASPEMARYEVDPASSSAGFTLQATGHTVEGTGGKVTGEFRRSKAPSGGAFTMEGEIRIESASLVTGNARRDGKMRRESLSVEKYPLIRFRPRRAKVSAQTDPIPDTSPGAKTSLTLEGDLTIRETTRPVSIPVSVLVGERRVTVDGSLRLNFNDYGVPDPSFLFLRVRPDMTVRFHLEAIPR